MNGIVRACVNVRGAVEWKNEDTYVAWGTDRQSESLCLIHFSPDELGAGKKYLTKGSWPRWVSCNYIFFQNVPPESS